MEAKYIPIFIIYFYLKVRDERQETEIFYPLVHCPNCNHSWN